MSRHIARSIAISYHGNSVLFALLAVIGNEVLPFRSGPGGASIAAAGSHAVQQAAVSHLAVSDASGSPDRLSRFERALVLAASSDPAVPFIEALDILLILEDVSARGPDDEDEMVAEMES